MEKQKTRDEIEEKYKWDLSNMFNSDEEWGKAFNDIDINDVLKYKGRIMESSDTLYDFYKAYEKMDRLTDSVYMYAALNLDVDTKDSKGQSMKKKVEKLFEDIQSKLSFIQPEILKTDYNKVLEYIKENKKLEEYKFDLEKMFRYKEHTLDENEEKIIADASNAMETGSEVFYNFDNADIDLGEITDEEGNKQKLTNSNYIKYMNSKDRNVRIDAFNHMYNYFKKFKNTLTAAYNGHVKENFFISKIRKYNSPLEMSLYHDNIDISVYKNLIETIHKYNPKMHEYMEVRKKILGLDEMHMYDIYVDIVNASTENIPFDEGKKIVFESLKPLGDTYLKDLEKAFTERWIDIYPNEGKKSGAYKWGCYDSYPYVLLNYNGTVDSVSTMAHELGHAMHSYYSNKNQSYINHNYPIFLAEIASTVNEVLVNDYLYRNAKTKEEKILYLTEFLDKVRTTIYRQTMFAEFEMLIHDKYEKNVPLTEEELSNTYYELNKMYYGENVVSDDLIRYEWSRIPHFYTSFYVYKYATGLSAALSIASDILAGKEEVKKSYLEFLSSGCSDYPLNILKKTGVDMETGEPISKAIDMFTKKLEKLKKLL